MNQQNHFCRHASAVMWALLVRACDRLNTYAARPFQNQPDDDHAIVIVILGMLDAEALPEISLLSSSVVSAIRTDQPARFALIKNICGQTRSHTTSLAGEV